MSEALGITLQVGKEKKYDTVRRHTPHAAGTKVKSERGFPRGGVEKQHSLDQFSVLSPIPTPSLYLSPVPRGDRVDVQEVSPPLGRAVHGVVCPERTSQGAWGTTGEGERHRYGPSFYMFPSAVLSYEPPPPCSCCRARPPLPRRTVRE